MGVQVSTDLMRGSIRVPVCDGIVVSTLQLHVLHTLAFGFLKLAGSIIIELARHVCKEGIVWYSDTGCNKRIYW